MVRFLSIFVSFSLLVSCGGDNDPDPLGIDVMDAGPDMAADGAPDTYVAGLERAGQNGLFSIRLNDSTPTPRDTGHYTWTITVLDSSGAPVSGATVQAEPTMPAHGHGTNPKYTDATEMEEPGVYELSEMDLFMEGVWNIMIRISSEDGRQDEVEYNFYLEG